MTKIRVLKRFCSTTLVVFLSLVLTSATAWAGSDIVPGCSASGFNFKGKNLHLTPGSAAKGQQWVYLLKNVSSGPVMLNHTVQQPSASAGWGSTLQPQYWSAITVNKPHFTLTCAQPGNKNKMQKVACSNVLQVCGSASAVKQPGSYWLTENQSTVSQLEQAIRARSVELSNSILNILGFPK